MKNIYSYISVVNMLGFVFIILKATGIIDWSYFWVASPFLVAIAFVIVVFVCELVSSLSVLHGWNLFRHNR